MKLGSLAILCVTVLILFSGGCSSSAPAVEIAVTPQSTIVFSTQTDQLTATDSLGSADVVWSVGGAGEARRLEQSMHLETSLHPKWFRTQPSS